MGKEFRRLVLVAFGDDELATARLVVALGRGHVKGGERDLAGAVLVEDPHRAVGNGVVLDRFGVTVAINQNRIVLRLGVAVRLLRLQLLHFVLDALHLGLAGVTGRRAAGREVGVIAVRGIVRRTIAARTIVRRSIGIAGIVGRRVVGRIVSQYVVAVTAPVAVTVRPGIPAPGPSPPGISAPEAETISAPPPAVAAPAPTVIAMPAPVAIAAPAVSPGVSAGDRHAGISGGGMVSRRAGVPGKSWADAHVAAHCVTTAHGMTAAAESAAALRPGRRA